MLWLVSKTRTNKGYEVLRYEVLRYDKERHTAELLAPDGEVYFDPNFYPQQLKQWYTLATVRPAFFKER